MSKDHDLGNLKKIVVNGGILSGAWQQVGPMLEQKVKVHVIHRHKAGGREALSLSPAQT